MGCNSVCFIQAYNEICAAIQFEVQAYNEICAAIQFEVQVYSRYVLRSSMNVECRMLLQDVLFLILFQKIFHKLV